MLSCWNKHWIATAYSSHVNILNNIHLFMIFLFLSFHGMRFFILNSHSTFYTPHSSLCTQLSTLYTKLNILSRHNDNEQWYRNNFLSQRLMALSSLFHKTSKIPAYSTIACALPVSSARASNKWPRYPMIRDQDKPNRITFCIPY